VPAYAYAVLAVGWLAWVAPFLLAKRNPEAPAQLDRRARWGIALQCIAYALLWQGRFWTASPSKWRFALSVFFQGMSVVLSWTSTWALGRQWRLDAGLSADHELVTAGAYRFVRHPIYCSMLCLLLGTGFMITPWVLFLLSTGVFIAGTEIRVRIEDKLLASRFGERFRKYQQSVPGYVPFVR
jgi:protein-S-isoprenylcysteine O-methyltransferase Ste14